jgi:hypothetical protein
VWHSPGFQDKILPGISAMVDLRHVFCFVVIVRLTIIALDYQWRLCSWPLWFAWNSVNYTLQIRQIHGCHKHARWLLTNEWVLTGSVFPDLTSALCSLHYASQSPDTLRTFFLILRFKFSYFRYKLDGYVMLYMISYLARGLFSKQELSRLYEWPALQKFYRQYMNDRLKSI